MANLNKVYFIFCRSFVTVTAVMAVAAKPSASHWDTLLCKGNTPQDCHSGTSNTFVAVPVAERLVANSLAQCKHRGVVAALLQVDKHNSGNRGNRDKGNASHMDHHHKILCHYAYAHDRPTPLRLIAANT